ncbi:hypothetical protein BZG36_04710 [Bifiguratus adelaidae]|uniref:Conserved oligomeric Golgi complex subunit 4 n=1 Tax=Bifiguratus adelaidae TaxID=1938954 RepID=A0A261XWH8_9FUNG|nr:hypothetical protein BZG36_04710 [Bifiguratus adelaidae]
MPSVADAGGESRHRKDLNSLLTLEDILGELRDLDDEEVELDEELNNAITSKKDVTERLDRLTQLRPKFQNLGGVSSDIVESIDRTSALAATISDKVRQLDAQQSRVRSAIQLVEDVQELKVCISGLQSAMSARDYDTAARMLHRCSQLDDVVIDGEFAEATVPTSEHPELPSKTLSDARDTLYKLFSSNFDMAVAARKEEDITRYFKLFPLIGCQEKGLDKYSRFVCGIVRGKCGENMAKPPKGAFFYAELLTSLFEHIATIVDQHQPLVELHYGRGKMLRVLQQLQEECDLQSRLILDSMIDERRFNDKIEVTQNTPPNNQNIPGARTATNRQYIDTPSSPPQNWESSLLDTRELDNNLNELVTISHRSHLYHRFMNYRAHEEISVLKAFGQDHLVFAGKDRDLFNENGLLKDDGTINRVSDIMQKYVIAEEWFFRRSLSKALEMDERDNSSVSSTCVDDALYITRKCLLRCISSADVHVLSNFVTKLCKHLEADYLTYLERSMSGPSIGDQGGPEGDPITFLMVALNNLDASADYLQRLHSEVTQEMGLNFGALPLSDPSNKPAMEALNSLTLEIPKFRTAQQDGMNLLFSQAIKPKIRPIFQDAYRDIKYVLDEDEYAEADMDDAFVRRFRNGLDRTLTSYKDGLSMTNLSKLLSLLIQAVAKQWERIITQTKFNQLGALRFDQDLRVITRYLTSLTDWPNRDPFTRLNQMSLLLSLEKPDEIYEYWGNASAVSWRLTIAEIKKILSLRMDFDANAISALVLDKS